MHDGTAVNHSLAINENTTLNHLIEEINDAFGGTATATLVNGQIRLTEQYQRRQPDAVELWPTTPVRAPRRWIVPAISQSTQGGSVAASLAGFAGGRFHARRSRPRIPRFKVDGYPLGADEWITRSSNTDRRRHHGVTLHLHDTGTVQVNLTRDIRIGQGQDSARWSMPTTRS